MDYLEWIMALRGVQQPRKVELSGEKCDDEDERPLGDFAALTERQWHALIVERAYHERHDCDDR